MVSNVVFLDSFFDPNRSFGLVFTQDIEGHGSLVANHASAPSLVGAFYVLGGCIGVIAGMCILVTFIASLWEIIEKTLKFSSAPAAAIFAGAFVLNFSSEGTIEGSLFSCVLLIPAFIFFEWLIFFNLSGFSTSSAFTRIRHT